MQMIANDCKCVNDYECVLKCVLKCVQHSSSVAKAVVESATRGFGHPLSSKVPCFAAMRNCRGGGSPKQRPPKPFAPWNAPTRMNQAAHSPGPT